jgi:ABC-type proline/glycine betaine transport system substrate-binding protein
MLKELSEDYSFLTISEDIDDVQENILQELDARQEYMKSHPDEWKTWEEVKNNIMKS